MKINSFITVIVIGLGIVFNAQSQDKHFSQFTASPLTMNPALTGMMNGDYRISGIYRSQWSKATAGDPYKTITAAADMGFLKEKLDGDYVGGGLVFYSDVAGTSEYGTNNMQLTASYHKSLGEEGNQYLSFGLKGGLVQRKINYANLEFGNQYQGDGDNLKPQNENFSSERKNFKYGDLSAGILWTYQASDRMSFYTGAMLAHLNRPNQTHYESQESRLSRKVSWIGGGQYSLDDKWDVVPSLMYLYQGKAQEFNFGTYFRFQNQPLKSNNIALYAGGWYRWNDAVIPAIKIDYKQYSMGFSYDINVSSLRATSKYQGGPEVSLVYIGAFSGPNLKKEQKVCPRF